MNANELADWIDERNISSSSQTLGKAATMLRQQQAEIEALKAHPVKEQLKEVELKATFNRGYKEGARDYASKCNPAELTDEEIHQAIRRGFARDGFLSDGIFLEIKELLRNTQGVNSEQVPDFFFMENDLMGKR